MSEARKLDPEVMGGREPLVHDPLPPLPPDATVDLSQPIQRTAEAAPLSRPTRRAHASSQPAVIDRASRTALILFLVGLVAFAAGIALSSAILLGVIDLQTGWVKDALTAAKELVKQLRTK